MYPVSPLSGPLRRGGLGGGLLCRKHRRGCDIEFRAVRAARKFLDGAAVERTRWKIHAVEVAARRENFIDEAQPLEQLLPVGVGNPAQAGNDVANGDVRGALLAMNIAHHRVCRRILDREALVKPFQRRRDLRILIAQTMDELDREGLRERSALMRHENDSGGFSRPSAGAQQAVRKAVRDLPLGAARGNLSRKPSEVLDQNDPERDRHRPKFTDGQRLHLLIGFDETNQCLGVEAAIGMGHERPGDAEYPGIACEGSGRELGKLAVVSGRQV